MVSGKGDVIHIPKLVAGTGAQQADLGNAGATTGSTSAAILWDRVNELEATITIDQHWYASKMVTDVGRVQALPSLMEKYTMAIGYDLANKIDAYIATAMAAGISTNVTTGATDAFDGDLTIQNHADLFEDVRGNNVDPIGDGCVYVCNYKIYNSILNPASQLGKYVSKSDVTAGARNLVSGLVPTFFGVPVVMSNQLSTGAGATSAMLVHPQSFGYAASIKPRVQASYDIDWLSTKVVAASLFGCGTINEEYSAELVNGAAS